MNPHRFQFLVLRLVLLSMAYGCASTVLAQAPAGKEVCFSSSENRYKCFMGSYDYAQERMDVRKQVQQQREALAAERLAQQEANGPQPSEGRIRELQRMQLQLEYSRARTGISYSGQPYSRTYGVFPEPGPDYSGR